MRIYRNHERERWEAISNFDERDTLKAARWLWDPIHRTWWSKIAENAIKLIEYADDATRTELNAAWETLANRVEASNAADSDVKLPVPAGHEYRPFQRAGIAAALERQHVLFADEMGLGKTVEALGVINSDESIRAVLIICPATLKVMWAEMLQEWCIRPVYVAIGSSRTPGSMAGRYGQRDQAQIFALILNYDIVAYWREYLQKARGLWDLLICDEAHYLKTPDSKRTIAVCGSERKVAQGILARRRLMLTGTPILNRPIELWSLLHYLDPQTWPKFWPFVQRYCGAYQDAYGWHFDGASNLEELNRKLRGSVMIRRMKADVLTELPAKQRMIIPIAANGAAPMLLEEREKFTAYENTIKRLEVERQAARLNRAQNELAYQDAVKALKEGWSIALENMSRVRHELALMKVPHVVEHVKGLLEGGADKVIVWAHHNDVTDTLAAALAEYFPLQIDGRTPTNRRQAIADMFQNEPERRVFLGGIHSAGEGLTLTAAHIAVFAEIDWTPAKLSQAEDRCHRIGQKDSVLVQHLLFDGSLDARMAKRIIKKQAVIDKAVNVGTGGDEPISLFDLD
jgi:SWI/SNF-related matrix-associated actin-dependent regulator 1 of chromatin subfamily A